MSFFIYIINFLFWLCVGFLASEIFFYKEKPEIAFKHLIQFFIDIKNIVIGKIKNLYEKGKKWLENQKLKNS